LRFLGTGASGGTPGHGRSRRLESSLLVEGEVSILIDVTRHFADQSSAIRSLDAVLLTHAHADAIGGMARLRRWWQERGGAPIPVHASAETIEVLERRFERLDHCRLIPLRDGQRRRIGPWSITPRTVPHAREKRYRTFAWKLRGDKVQIVYASDVSKLTHALERFSRGSSILVIDGAMWQRQIFTHLTIDRALPVLCCWDVEQIVLTQIGKTAPQHETLKREVAARCARALPAYDCMAIRL
jgi:phosphoribosyl 1,2-cyclic phosphate phosphodiesterase